MVIRRDAPLDLLLEARFQHYADGAVPVSDINRVLFVSLRAIFFVPKSRPMQSQLLPRYLIFAGLFLLHLVRAGEYWSNVGIITGWLTPSFTKS